MPGLFYRSFVSMESPKLLTFLSIMQTRQNTSLSASLSDTHNLSAQNSYDRNTLKLAYYESFVL
jgi:hypothetical protein